MNKITVFTLALFGYNYTLEKRKYYLGSWGKNLKNADIKIYTESDKIVQEALEDGKEYIDLFCKYNLKNYASNYVRLYMLQRLPYHLYLDTDVYIYNDLLENIDLESPYIDMFDYTFQYSSGVLGAIYSGKKLNTQPALDWLKKCANDINQELLKENNKDMSKFIENCKESIISDNYVVSLLLQNNSCRKFPNNCFLHTMSFWPLLPTLCRGINKIYIHKKPLPECSMLISNSLYNSLPKGVNIYIDNENKTELKLYNFYPFNCGETNYDVCIIGIPNYFRSVDSIAKLIKNTITMVDTNQLAFIEYND